MAAPATAGADGAAAIVLERKVVPVMPMAQDNKREVKIKTRDHMYSYRVLVC